MRPRRVPRGACENDKLQFLAGQNALELLLSLSSVKVFSIIETTYMVARVLESRASHSIRTQELLIDKQHETMKKMIALLFLEMKHPRVDL